MTAQAAPTGQGSATHAALNLNGQHVRSFVVKGKGGARAFVSTTAPTGPRPVRRFDTGQALSVDPTAVLFTPQPGASQPSDQPYTFASDYSLSSAGFNSPTAYSSGNSGAITSADFLGDGREETVTAERCNGPDICLHIRRPDGSYSDWWDTGLSLDAIDTEPAERIVLTAADFNGTGSPQLAMAYETNNYTVNLATFNVDATETQDQPFTQTGITNVGQLMINDSDGNNRQSFDITTGDFAGDGMQEVAVAYVTPLPIYPSYSQAQVSIYGMQSNQLMSEGGLVVATNPYYLSIASGNVLRGPDAGPGDDVVLATGYPTSQQVDVFSLSSANSSFSQYRSADYQSNATGQYKSDLTDANIKVATGDFQGDGTDEVVIAQTGDETAGAFEDYNPVELITVGSSSSDSSLSLINATAYCCTTGPNFSGQFTLGVSNLQPINPNAQFSSITPQIVVSNDVTNTTFGSCPYADCLEILTFPGNFQGPGVWHNNSIQYFPLASQDETTYTPYNDEGDRTAFALTDPNGNSLTLGSPTQFIAGGTAVPLVVLRAPPVHFDQFGSKTYDVNNCYGSSLGTCGFSSSFSDSQQTTFTTDVNQTDSWAASATVSGGVSYAGFDVEASLQGRYGNNFSKENNSSVNTQVTVQVNATVDDYVFYRKTDYVVMEYPIYGAGNTTLGQPNAYIAVITGVDTSYAFENTSPGSTVAPLLDNVHQRRNLLSYPYYFPPGNGEPSNSIDDNAEVAPASAGASVASTPFPSISIGQTGSANGQDSFANQTGQTIANTQTDGYTLTASVGYESEGVPVKAKVEGSYQYDQSNFQSQSSTFGTTMQLNWNTGSLNRSIGGTNYTMRPYLYWSKAGALVLDWEVELPTSNNGVPTFWGQMYGQQPDPALNLPDLLDAAKGYSAPQGGLQFNDPELLFSSSAPTPGPITISTLVHNYSLHNEAAWPEVRFYLGDPAHGGLYIGSGSSGCYASGNCLPAQYTATSHMSWVIPSGLGGRDIRIYAAVDPGHSIQEIHYTNNVGWGFTHVYGNLAPAADVSLTGSDIGISNGYPAPGATISVRATVHAGPVAPGPVQVNFWQGNPATNGTMFASTTLSGVPAGGSSTTGPVSWTVPAKTGQNTLYVQVIPLTTYDTNMLNNTASTTLNSAALFVSNTTANSITSYKLGASGNAGPLAQISGAATGLSGPRGLLVNSYGHVTVANSGANSITEYAPGSSGNVSPVATISGPATGLNQPQGLALDGSGDLFGANKASITEYVPGANGNVKPKAKITGAATGLNQPRGLTIDGSGHLFVANKGANSVTEYAKGAAGNAKPLNTIVGAAPGLNSPQGALIDSSGNLRVSNAGSSTIKTFAPSSRGNASPLATLAGTTTGLKAPGGMDVNGMGQVAVANAGAGSVTLFAPTATGNAAPVVTIVGTATGLNGPSFVSFTPPPAAVTGATTAIGPRQATLTGSVTSDGSATWWFFQYRRAGTSAWAGTAQSFVSSGASGSRVKLVLRQLKSGATYQYRLVANNPGGSATGATSQFKTAPARRRAKPQ
jgi:hypothetical protein